MADAFLVCVGFTLRQDIEGGLVDDPRDHGGITNMGLTISDLSVWERHRATADDVRDLAREEAVAIYRALYWQPIRGDDLFPAVAMMVFDHGVNRGIGRSAKILQAMLGVDVDGVIGPQTLSAMVLQAYGGQAALVGALHDAQRGDYLALQNPVFETGWLARADKRYLAAMQLVAGSQS